MSLIEDIRNDCEAGTPGPWHVGKDAEEGKGFGWFIGGGGYCRAQVVGPIIHTQANARRIARVPDMEARILSDAVKLKAAEELADAIAALICHPVNKKTGGRLILEVDVIQCDRALAAYRDACK